MSPPFDPDVPVRHRQFVQLIVGLLALPLSAFCPSWPTASSPPKDGCSETGSIVAVSPAAAARTHRRAAAAPAVAGAPRYRGKVMALVYHGVGSTSDAEGGFVVSPSRFGEHLATLRAAGMQTVTAADVARAFAGGQPVPDRR